MKPKDVLAHAKENGGKMLDLRFMDFPGLWQHFSVPINQLDEGSFEDGFGFDGSSIRGWQPINASDMLVCGSRNYPAPRNAADGIERKSKRGIVDTIKIDLRKRCSRLAGFSSPLVRPRLLVGALGVWRVRHHKPDRPRPHLGEHVNASAVVDGDAVLRKVRTLRHAVTLGSKQATWPCADMRTEVRTRRRRAVHCTTTLGAMGGRWRMEHAAPVVNSPRQTIGLRSASTARAE